MNRYIVFNFLKIIFFITLAFFCIGIIMNLFEEIEFFKKYNNDLILPIVLTLAILPDLLTMILLPFIIFLSAVWYLKSIRENKDLLSLKVFGLSNLKISITISTVAFFIGIFVILTINPISSSLLKFYENTKAKYSDEVIHLVSFNKNGIWIKDFINENSYIIKAEKIIGNNLQNLTIYEFDSERNLKKRIDSQNANISTNSWEIANPKIFNFLTLENSENDTILFQSNYDLNKINSIYKNINTLSFFEIVNGYNDLQKRGYSEEKLRERLHNLFSLPIYLFLMVLLASIFMLLKPLKNNTFYISFFSILTCVSLFYLKDLSMALGQTGRISLELSIWMPIILISLINIVGIIQINEK